MMRRKMIYILLSVMLLTLVPLTGCGGGGGEAAADDTQAIQAAAEGFMDAMQAGDIEAMKEYADPSLFAEDGDLYAFNNIDSMSSEMAEAVGLEESDLSDQTKADLQEFVNSLMAGLVDSYEITNVSEEAGVGSVDVTTNYGFDPEKMQEIDMNDEIESMAEEYMKEHQDELMEIYNSEGQDAMIAKLLDGMMGDVLKKYIDAVMETGSISQNSVLTIENQEGKWVVTGDKPTE